MRHLTAALFLLAPGLARAEGEAVRTVEQLAASARPSVVVISFTGRDGKRQGLGTGFVVGEGLIATNLHVLGDGRPLAVETSDGKRHEVTSVHASDRGLDLALIRVADKALQPLPLGDSDALKDGAEVVALGNPQGLRHSVVSGVVSGRREIDGRAMIQLAIPIEPGNSGGPLLDRRGRVQGVLTLKSAVTANLGFAVPVNVLKPLIEKPNPIPMARWLTLGQLDAEEWDVLFGGRWRQRTGRILTEGQGQGFGGRTLCLAKKPAPALPYELTVTVKLDDESGAAGLVFHADGEYRHYGFYPSSGQLRFTRFEGPDVFSWQVLKQFKTPHYRPGDWNTLKVRVEKGKILAYVNGHLVVESADDGLTEGRVGLAKFRDTRAEFKSFQVGQSVAAAAPAADAVRRVTEAVQKLPATGPVTPGLVESLTPDAALGVSALRERARQLEQQAAQLKQLAQAVHQRRVLTDLEQVLKPGEDKIDLVHAALLIARLDNDEVDVAAYRQEVERLAARIRKTLPRDANDKAKLAALNRYLFAENGFHGSRGDYYSRSNSYLNEVLDDREGLPITLTVLYMELAGRLGVKVVGVALPGHFVARHVAAEGESPWLDIFDGARPLTRKEIEQRVLAATEQPLREEQLRPATKKAILVRMLHNLMNVARNEEDPAGVLRYLDAILTVDPQTGEERLARAVLRLQRNDRAGAREDAEWLLEHKPEGVDLRKVRQLRDFLAEPDR